MTSTSRPPGTPPTPARWTGTSSSRRHAYRFPVFFTVWRMRAKCGSAQRPGLHCGPFPLVAHHTGAAGGSRSCPRNRPLGRRAPQARKDQDQHGAAMLCMRPGRADAHRTALLRRPQVPPDTRRRTRTETVGASRVAVSGVTAKSDRTPGAQRSTSLAVEQSRTSRSRW